MNSPKRQQRSQSKLFINQICYLLISFNVGISSITSLATNYLFKDKFKINPATTTQILFITNLPWLLKPILGIITDFIPICGYRRKVYLILTGVINSLCWVLMSYFTNSIANVTFLLTVVNATLSMSTVIGQATVVELSKERGLYYEVLQSSSQSCGPQSCELLLFSLPLQSNSIRSKDYGESFCIWYVGRW